MSEQPEHPRVTAHVVALFTAAATLGVAALLLPRTAVALLAVLAGSVATATVAHFAWLRARLAARRGGQRGQAQGRIVERRSASHVVFELPADGLEPWSLDAWVLGVVTLAVVLLGPGSGRALFAFVAALIAVVAARLYAMRADRIRVEIEPGAYRVEALEGGRRIQHAGQGTLLPDLEADRLTLWSPAGRIGVLRHELTAPERAWLAARLTELAAAAPPERRSAARDTSHPHSEQTSG